MKFTKLFYVVVLILSITISCEKDEDEFQSSAVITGPDVRDCICCGGFFIELDDSTYNFNTLPAESDIDLLTETFPIDVKLNWDFANKCGDLQYIEITRIRKN